MNIILFCGMIKADKEDFIMQKERSDVMPKGLPVQVCCTVATAEEKESIRHYVERFVKHFGNDVDTLLSSNFFKLTPNSASPYKQLYVNNL